VRKGEENQERLEMDGTHHILSYTDVKLLDGSIRKCYEEKQKLLDTAMIGLEVNAGYTGCFMFLSSECRKI
jgi:hypothetical protein